MSSAVPSQQSYADFYQAEYGSHIRRLADRGPITLLDLYQTAGDFSDQATDDVCVIRSLSRSHIHANLSGGAFSRWGSRGDLGLNPAGFANSIVVDQQHHIDILCVPLAALRAVDWDEALPKNGDFGAVHAGLLRDDAMNAFIDRLWALDGAGAAELQAETSTVWLADRLASWARGGIPAVRSATEKMSSYMLGLVKDRLGQPGLKQVSLVELAAMARLSPHHFCRAFKAATGLPPHRWQIMRRMERARTLLSNTKLSIAEVGEAVGYDDPAYFSRIFARETGASPRVWRQQTSL